MGMINSLKDELAFLEESNANLLTQMRESQNSNYVLTEELSRVQHNNLNTIDELQACQTANSVLRQELQRLEQSSVKMVRDADKYKKANTMLRDEIHELKAHHRNRKNSMVTLKEKAMDLQKDILEKEKDYRDLSSLKQTVNIIVEAVDNDTTNTAINSDNGYYPTDSDSVASNEDEETNDDKQLGAFTPKPVKKSDTFSSSLPSPLARKFFSQGGIGIRSPLLRRKVQEKHNNNTNNKHGSSTDLTERSRSRSLNLVNTSNNSSRAGSRDQSPSPPNSSVVYSQQQQPGPAVVRRRGSLDSIHGSGKEFMTTRDSSASLRNDTLTRQLGKSLERLNDHKIKRSESGASLRPRSMTFDDRRFDGLTLTMTNNHNLLRSSSGNTLI